MYTVGEEEIEAIANAIRGGALFRYGVGGECDRFEERYAAYLGVKHVALTVSGTFALSAAVTALGLGPGDEVLIPAHTYMATATAVLTAGAIPVIVDIHKAWACARRRWVEIQYIVASVVQSITATTDTLEGVALGFVTARS